MTGHGTPAATAHGPAGILDDAETIAREAYDRCHPEDTFEDLKRRARFSKEDRGLLGDWMTYAAREIAKTK